MKAILCILLLCSVSRAFAEPYLAVRTGHACSMCHTNPSGGGKRTVFGNIYAQQQLPVRPLSSDTEFWSGNIIDRFSIGGNARLAGRQIDLDDRDDNLDFNVNRVTLYLSAELSEQVALYVDQRIAPGSSLNREVWAQFKWDDWYIKAGKLFLPFGWRLEDDTAFIRETTGVNFNTSDNGIEIGYSQGKFNLQLAVTNGNGGASEIDDTKLFSTRAEWIESGWRAGVSALNNNTDLGERSIYGLFAGLKTGPVNWLFEYDHINDSGFTVKDMTQDVSLLEANVLLRQGHNLKLTLEAITFNGDIENRYRSSIVYEYFPWAFSQFRLGLRKKDSDDKDPVHNSEESFAEIHVFF